MKDNDTGVEISWRQGVVGMGGGGVKLGLYFLCPLTGVNGRRQWHSA